MSINMKADDTVHLIGRVKVLMNQFIISELENQGVIGIVPSHGDIIITLLNDEYLTMSEIAEKIEKDPSTVTTLVKKLNDLGYTTILKDSIDRRANRVSLTPKGKALKSVMINISEKMYEMQYRNIGEKEKNIFRDVLKQIMKNFN